MKIKMVLKGDKNICDFLEIISDSQEKEVYIEGKKEDNKYVYESDYFDFTKTALMRIMYGTLIMFREPL